MSVHRGGLNVILSRGHRLDRLRRGVSWRIRCHVLRLAKHYADDVIGNPFIPQVHNILGFEVINRAGILDVAHHHLLADLCLAQL